MQRNQLAKNRKKQYDNIAITIVCDMLLTGYDVPIVQVMYLDKLLTEHNLLQAIARVNRTLDILLPSPEALKYEYDFKLYNEIKFQPGKTSWQNPY